MQPIKKNIRRVLLVRLVSGLLKKTGHVRDMRVPFELKYMQAILRKAGGLEVKLVDEALGNQCLGAIAEGTNEFDPDAVVILNTSLEYKQALALARSLKSRKSPLIIATGHDATAEPGRYIFEGSPVDIVLKGEGEAVLLETLQAVTSGRGLDGVSGAVTADYANPDTALVADLDSLAQPCYSLQELTSYRFYYPVSSFGKAVWGHILTSRGCPYECIFCSQVIRESYGKQVRLRDAKKVVDEIMSLQSRGARIIAFDDDNFTNSAQHVRRICNQILERKLSIRWSAQARVDNCDAELLALMKRAGCVLLRFGVESGSEKVIASLRKSSEAGWTDQARRVFKTARHLKLDTAALFVIGSPGEDEEDVKKSIALAKELRPDIVQLHFCTPYPGSFLYSTHRAAIDENRLDLAYHYSPPLYNFSKIENAALIKLYRRFYYQTIVNPSFMIRHARKYGAFYLSNSAVFSALFKTMGTLFLKTNAHNLPQAR